jgi:hypothetical protein
MYFAIDLHEHLVDVPLPLRDLAHVAGAPQTDLAGEHRSETVHPLPNALMADVNSTLVKEVFDVAKGQRKTSVHHDRGCCQSNATPSPASLGAPDPIQPEAGAILGEQRRGLI